MSKILNVNIVVPDNITSDKILAIVSAIAVEGFKVANATLQTDELKWVDGDGFTDLK